MRYHLFPAHAGMNRHKTSFIAISSTVPRTRGDEPCAPMCSIAGRNCSPHTRG